MERTTGRGLIPTRLAMHHEHALNRQARKGFRHELGRVEVERTDETKRRRSGICQRAQQIEYRANAHGTTHRAHSLHGRVMMWRKQEREAGGREAAANISPLQRQLQAQRFEQVCAAGTAADAAIAMLDHLRTRRCRQQRRARGKVHAAGAVAARANYVHRLAHERQFGAARQRAHPLGKAADFISHHALGAQCHQLRGHHRRRKALVC